MAPDLPGRSAGHFFTVFPYLCWQVRRRAPEPERPWSTALDDPVVGRIHLRGSLREVPGASTVVVVVHGLGGGPGSYSCALAADAAAAFGCSALRMGMRGADRSGEDYYHAGLTADLHAAVASADLRRYENVLLLGYSVGGNTALLYAAERGDPRVRAVAAVSAPLDLHAGQRHIDRRRSWLYRRLLLDGLLDIYRAVAARRSVPTDPELVRRAGSFYAFDHLVIGPRYGFRTPLEYYETASSGPRLSELRVPALILHGALDPVVPLDTVSPQIARAGSAVEAAVIARGGHLGAPPDLDLGFGPCRGVAGQAIGWLLKH